MRLALFFLFATSLGGFLLAGPHEGPWMWARVAVYVIASGLIGWNGRDVSKWLAGDLTCHDPYCLSCRMRMLDMRRMEIEIMEQVKAQAEVRGERTH